ncbi:hypothetical protein Q8A73_013083 [Channa argus]|nr:hypothetical protein Q8A73_013083 [Channa argus]
MRHFQLQGALLQCTYFMQDSMDNSSCLDELVLSRTYGFVQAEVQEEAKKAKTTHVWIGLRYTCTLDLWFWVSDEPVCYDNWDLPKKTNECKVILIKQDKTWNEALNYCRKKYHDLVSITSPNIQAEVQEEAKKAKTTHLWIGLRYTCTLDLWFWVSDEPVCYDNWDLPKKTNECGHAAAMEPNGQNKDQVLCRHPPQAVATTMDNQNARGTLSGQLFIELGKDTFLDATPPWQSSSSSSLVERGHLGLYRCTGKFDCKAVFSRIFLERPSSFSSLERCILG